MNFSNSLQILKSLKDSDIRTIYFLKRHLNLVKVSPRLQLLSAFSYQLSLPFKPSSSHVELYGKEGTLLLKWVAMYNAKKSPWRNYPNSVLIHSTFHKRLWDDMLTLETFLGIDSKRQSGLSRILMQMIQHIMRFNRHSDEQSPAST